MVAGGFRTGFPDVNVTIEDQIAEGDGVATRWTSLRRLFMLPEMRRVNVAALSLLVPGWGQFEQRRPRAGYAFLVWAVVACAVALASPSTGVPVAVAVLDLIVVTVWSAVDAFLASPRE